MSSMSKVNSSFEILKLYLCGKLESAPGVMSESGSKHHSQSPPVEGASRGGFECYYRLWLCSSHAYQ